MREDKDLIRITQGFFDNDKPIASVCHGVEIPATADRVRGRRMATVAKCRFDLEICGGIPKRISPLTVTSTVGAPGMTTVPTSATGYGR